MKRSARFARKNEIQVRTMIRVASLPATFAFVFSLNASAYEGFAEFGKPLKEKYEVPGFADKNAWFRRTGQTADGFSVICNMGQALPSIDRGEGWYTNKPITGLRLELRARAAYRASDEDLVSAGFVVITKNEEVLKVFRPKGEYQSGKWDGDVLNTWGIENGEVSVFSELSGSDGYAHFDLMSGQGFYYKQYWSDDPDYFLTNCRKVTKRNLPVYDYFFE